MSREYEIRSEFQANYQYAHDFWASFNENARVYTLAASGHTWSDAELKNLQGEGREPIEFNIIRRPLQFYSGYLRDNLNSIVYSPVEGSDEKTADQFTELGYDRWDKGSGYKKFLDSADECLKSGISLCGLRMDYSKDFVNGDIVFFNRTYNSFYLDPTFENIDLSDCGYAITRDLMNRETVKQLLPFVDPQVIDDIPTSFRDDKFIQYHPNFTTMMKAKNLIAYDQYYRATTRKRKFLVNRDNSFYRDITDLPKEELDKLKAGIPRLKQLRESEDFVNTQGLALDVDIMDVERPFIELNIMLNGIPVYTGEDQTKIAERYPFAPNICYFEPSIWMASKRIQGIPATLYSNQRQFNKRHMKIIDMIDSDISKGYKYIIGSINDPDELRQSGQNKIIGINEDARDGLNSVQELVGGTTSPSLIEYQNVLDQMSLTLANVTESVLGIDEKGNTQISGRLAQVRIGQGLRSCRKVFDNISEAQRVIGGLLLEAIQKNYPAGKVARILGEQPTEQFYSQEFENFDAVIKEGIRSQSQKDAYYSELVNLKRDGIIDVPQSEIVDALQIAGISSLKESIEQQQQAQQQQLQKQEEIQTATALKQLEVLDATKESQYSLAHERDTRGDANEGLTAERASESVQNLAQAELDKAKTMVELSKLNEDRIMQVAQFVNQIHLQEQAERQRVEEKIQVESAVEDKSQTQQLQLTQGG
jgi:hypothetical protein